MRDQGPLSPIPYPIRIFVGMIAYSTVSKALYGQGTARYSDEERESLRAEGWSSLDQLLAANTQAVKGIPWLLGGSSPTEADATLYGFLAASLISGSV